MPERHLKAFLRCITAACPLGNLIQSKRQMRVVQACVAARATTAQGAVGRKQQAKLPAFSRSAGDSTKGIFAVAAAARERQGVGGRGDKGANSLV